MGARIFGFPLHWTPGVHRRDELRCRVLEVLAASVRRGVPLAPVVCAAATEHRGHGHRGLVELSMRLDDGLPLSEALGKCRVLAFPGHVVAAAHAADGTAHLAGVLDAAADDDAALHQVRHRAWTAAFYPSVVVLFVGAVAGGFLGMTTARFEQVWASMDLGAAPGQFAAGLAAGRVSGWVALTLAVAIAGALLLRRMPSLRRVFPAPVRSAWQSLPGLRGPARLAGAARLLRALSATARSGMPLHAALLRAAPAAGCRAVERSALDAARMLEAGAPADVAIDALLVPPSVRARAALAARRDAPGFADAIAELAEECTTRCRDAVESRLRFAEPCVTVAVGALVFAQMAGVFGMIEAVRRQVPLW